MGMKIQSRECAITAEIPFTRLFSSANTEILLELRILPSNSGDFSNKDC